MVFEARDSLGHHRQRGAGHIITPLSRMRALLTAESSWSMRKRVLSLVVKGPMDSRNLVMLLLYRVDDCVGRRLGMSVKPMQFTPCTQCDAGDQQL